MRDGMDAGGRIQHVSARDNPLLQRLRRLGADPVAYRRQGEVWLEGDHLCSAAVLRGVEVPLAVLADSAWTGEGGQAQPGDATAIRLSALALRARRVVVISEALFRGISGLESPARIGYLLAFAGQPEVLPGVPTLVLDRLQDAGNVGTLLRSASALGVRQVVALKGTAGLWSAKVLRAGMGAHWALHLVEQVQVADLQRLALPLVATSSHAQHELHTAPLPSPCAWVLGHEGQGVSGELMAACAMTVSIPQPGGEESLNVGVAGAICLYESLRRRLA